MPKWLRRQLIESAKVAKETKKLDRVTDLFDTIYDLYKASDPQATLELLGKSDDINDFYKLARFGARFGNRSPVFLKITGDDGINAFDNLF